MSKRFRFWVRCSTVATLTVLLTFNPAWAGRGLLRFLKRNNDSCVVETNCCPVPQPCVVETPCCAPVVSTPVCEAPVVSAPCCDGSISHAIPMDSVPQQVVPSPLNGEAGSIGQVVEPATPPATNNTPPADPTPPTNNVPPAELSPSDTTPQPETPAQPAAPVEQPANPPAAEVDTPFPNNEANPPAAEVPAAEPPAAEVPPAEPVAPAADPDPFGAQANPAPAGNDPFAAELLSL